jgi:multiple sugar transport system ATP-binding protein
MVYVTHDQEEALTLGDRVVLLDRGVVLQADRPQTIYDRPMSRQVAAFAGWPPMNFLEGRVVAESGSLYLKRGACALLLAARQDEWQAYAGREVVLGIRPDQVRVCATGSLHSSLKAEVQRVERIGAYCLATLRYGEWTVTARLEGTSPAPEGSQAAVEFALGQAHLFDAETGRALSSGRSES